MKAWHKRLLVAAVVLFVALNLFQPRRTLVRQEWMWLYQPLAGSTLEEAVRDEFGRMMTQLHGEEGVAAVRTGLTWQGKQVTVTDEVEYHREYLGRKPGAGDYFSCIATVTRTVTDETNGGFLAAGRRVYTYTGYSDSDPESTMRAVVWQDSCTESYPDGDVLFTAFP